MELQETQKLFPHRFLLIPGVVSPLTCRHRGPCACHGAPPQPPATTTPPATHTTACLSTPATPHEPDEFQLQFPAFLRAVYNALTPFPDARKAVLQVIHQFAGLTQPDPYPEPGFA